MCHHAMMRRWLMVLFAVLPILAATAPANAAPAQTTVETAIGRIGDTLRVHDGDLIADLP